MDGDAIPRSILKHFNLSGALPFAEAAAEIASRRKSYPNGQLFIDRLLSFADINCQ